MSGKRQVLHWAAHRHARALCERFLGVVEDAVAELPATSATVRGDLFQEGALALMVVAARYIEEAGGRSLVPHEERKFATEAGLEVRQALARALRRAEEEAENDKRMVEDVGIFDRVEREMRHLLERPATEAELSERLEWTGARVREIRTLRDEARLRADMELIPYLDDTDMDETIAELLDIESRHDPGTEGGTN